jgi:hypothetical protein
VLVGKYHRGAPVQDREEAREKDVVNGYRDLCVTELLSPIRQVVGSLSLVVLFKEPWLHLSKLGRAEGLEVSLYRRVRGTLRFVAS